VRTKHQKQKQCQHSQCPAKYYWHSCCLTAGSRKNNPQKIMTDSRSNHPTIDRQPQNPEQRLNPEHRDYRAAIKKMYAPSDFSFTPPLILCLVALAVYAGWTTDLDNYMTPESGLGYWLGIIGGSLLLILLLYPLRKRVRWMRDFGPVRYWFRAHMIMGLVGPLLILYHCNFSLGAVNSNVSLLAMALVVGSGVFGRYIYNKIHYGLYGKKFTLEELRIDKAITTERLDIALNSMPELKRQLIEFETAVLTSKSNVRGSFLRMLVVGLKARKSYWTAIFTIPSTLRTVARELDWNQAEYSTHKKETRDFIGAHLSSIVRLVQYQFFERLFAKWHVLHIPLFVLLLITGVYHVVAVHMY